MVAIPVIPAVAVIPRPIATETHKDILAVMIWIYIIKPPVRTPAVSNNEIPARINCSVTQMAMIIKIWTSVTPLVIGIAVIVMTVIL
jgi:hypothetical protein